MYIPEYITLSKTQPYIRVLVKKSTVAKRVAIKISHNQPLLVVPKNHFKEAHNFLLSKESWIRKKVLEKENTKHVIDHSYLPIFGVPHKLNYITSSNEQIDINYLNKTIDICYSKDPTQKRYALIKFLQSYLLNNIATKVHKVALHYGLEFSKIRISNAKGSWGSCNHNQVLAFNWRLIFTPNEIIDYVVIHEVCHLQEMNHSRDFWNLVSALSPHYKIHRAWLRKNSSILYQYLPCANS